LNDKGENGMKNETNWREFGNEISDSEGELRDISAIRNELNTIKENLSTHSMNEHQLYLNGRKDMLIEVIKYLERV